MYTEESLYNGTPGTRESVIYNMKVSFIQKLSYTHLE